MSTGWKIRTACRLALIIKACARPVLVQCPTAAVLAHSDDLCEDVDSCHLDFLNDINNDDICGDVDRFAWMAACMSSVYEYAFC